MWYIEMKGTLWFFIKKFHKIWEILNRKYYPLFKKIMEEYNELLEKCKKDFLEEIKEHTTQYPLVEMRIPVSTLHQDVYLGWILSKIYSI